LKDVALAFDWHDAPYYGKPVTGWSERSTSGERASLLLPNCTPKRGLTLCIVPLESREDLPALVLELLGQIHSYVKGKAYIAFDNGFQDKELIEELKLRKIPFILPLRDTAKLEIGKAGG
jgi:hypothetical protein